MRPSHFALSQSPYRLSSTCGKDIKAEWLTLSFSFLLIPKNIFLSSMTTRFVRMNVKVLSIRWVPQLSDHGCGNIEDYTDSMAKNPQTSFLYWRLAKCKLQPLYNLGALICMKYESVVWRRHAVTEWWRFKCSLWQSCAQSESPHCFMY